MNKKKCDVRTVHEQDDRPIIIYDVPYIIDDGGDKLFEAEDVISQFKNGDWDYIDEEQEVE